jgi:dsRNA-specific ribonuclease
MTDIYRGPRDSSYIAMIRSFLERGKLKGEYISSLLTDESLVVWDAVFTSEEANPRSNSEIYEFLGDGSINNALVFYLLRRFPQLKCSKGVKVLARLKINMVSRDYFASIASTLGFEPYITATSKERATDIRKLLEDCLEAAFGALVWMLDEKIRIGVGNSIAYNIIASVLDEREISLEYTSLFDAITRLKEIFDVPAFKDRGIGLMKKIEGSPNPTASNPMDAFIATVTRETPRKTIEILGRATGPTLSDAKQAAASKAIEVLNSQGFRKEIAQEYLRFCRY